MNQLTEIQKAWLAAIVDGEGVVTISKARQSARSGQFCLRVFVIVTNSSAALIGLLKDVTGVGCTYLGQRPWKENWTRVHRWQVCTAQAREFLRAIRPYLVVKAQITDVILAMPRRPRGKQDDGTIYRMQLETLAQVRELNKRGVKPFNGWNQVPENHPLKPHLVTG